MTASESVEQNVNTHSRPSALRITDLRVACLVGLPMPCSIIRIDTNQGLSGYGEVRDGASKTYALMLKSRIVGENPCNVDQIFRKIKQFGHHARQAGGVCGIEMALMDLAGKAYGVPAYQTGGREVPRQDPVLCRYPFPAGPGRNGKDAQATHGSGLQVSQDGCRDRPAGGRAGSDQRAAGNARN